jgi:hypothetical protein
MGKYESEADFAENYYNDIMDVPDALVIDWDETFHQSLSDHYDYVKGHMKGYVFRHDLRITNTPGSTDTLVPVVALAH